MLNQENRKMLRKVLIMAGGTGGHVFPALAVADVLRAQQVTVYWLGTARGLENNIVPTTGIPLSHININQWRGKGLKKLIVAPWQLIQATRQAYRIIKQIDPDVVLGMGGFASGPGGIAARLCRKPLVIHEQNSIPGLTNRVLGLMANRVLAAFPNTFSPRYHAETIGNPVRAAISALPSPEQRMAHRQGQLRLLVLGGSQGAHRLNQVLPEAIALLPEKSLPEIWHQSGPKTFAETEQRYQELGIPAHVTAFIDDMAEAYAWADLVVCRSGALTVSEIMATGLASILIPYPYAADNHQFYNAQQLVQPGAATMILSDDLSAQRLAESLQIYLEQRQQLINMANSARELYHPHAAEKVASIINELNIQDKKLQTSES